MTEETKVGGWPGYGKEQLSLEIWVRDRFGDRHFENLDERTLRIVEEAVELHQAESHMSAETTRLRLHKLVDTIMDSPPGKPSQETAGVQTTLMAYAAAAGIDIRAVTSAEIDRIYKIPREALLAKRRLRAEQAIGDPVE